MSICPDSEAAGPCMVHKIRVPSFQKDLFLSSFPWPRILQHIMASPFSIHLMYPLKSSSTPWATPSRSKQLLHNNLLFFQRVNVFKPWRRLNMLYCTFWKTVDLRVVNVRTRLFHKTVACCCNLFTTVPACTDERTLPDKPFEWALICPSILVFRIYTEEKPGDAAIMLFIKHLREEESGLYTCEGIYANNEKMTAQVQISTYSESNKYCIFSGNDQPRRDLQRANVYKYQYLFSWDHLGWRSRGTKCRDLYGLQNSMRGQSLTACHHWLVKRKPYHLHG